MPKRATYLWLAVVWTSACSSTPAAPVSRPPAQPAPVPSPAQAAPAQLDELARLNAEFAKTGVQETVAGQRVDDPYRALEQDTPSTQAWITAQTAATEA